MIYIEIMKQAAVEAGDFMRGSTDHAHTEKTNAKDFVTIADIKSQGILRHALHAKFPNEIVLSEEDTEQQREALYDPNFTGFIIDPIDGTFNFKHGMQESAVSIGRIEKGEPTHGVIYDPYKNELYETQVGAGALLNGKPVHVSQHTELTGASIATSNSYDDEGMARNLKRHLALYEQTNIMPWTSCPGSGVLIMAWVACGRIDAYHHNGLKPWDNAAAFLLVREAGGEVQALTGKRASFTSQSTLMGNRVIVETIRDAFENIPVELLG